VCVYFVLHDGGLEDLILGVLPHAALNHDPHLDYLAEILQSQRPNPKP
jgi:hypothetical protein